MPLNTFLTVARVVFVLNYCNVSRLLDIPRVQRPVQCRWTPCWRWSESSLFSIVMLFLGYLIFLVNEEPKSLAMPLNNFLRVTCVVFSLNYFNVSRLLDILRVQGALTMPLNAFLTVTRVVFVLNYITVTRLPDLSRLQQTVQCRWTPFGRHSCCLCSQLLYCL